VPVLVCTGEYDFVTPSGLGDEVYNLMSSPIREKFHFAKSGKNIEEREAYVNTFHAFIERVR
jgi:hypothetical protein